jgi:hypothetical protein
MKTKCWVLGLFPFPTWKCIYTFEETDIERLGFGKHWSLNTNLGWQVQTVRRYMNFYYHFFNTCFWKSAMTFMIQEKYRCSSSAHKIQLIYIRHRLLIKHVYYGFGLLNKHTSSLSAQAIIILKGHKSAQGPNFLDTKSRQCNRQNGRTICYFSHQCFY